MEPEIDQQAPRPVTAPDAPLAPATIQPEKPESSYRGLRWIFIGSDGLRAGWSVLIFFALLIGFMTGLGFLFASLHLISKGAFTPKTAIFSELFQLIALIAAGGVLAVIERRSLFDYNLRGARRVIHFVSGLVIGFLALSALVGGLAAGHWLSFGPATLSGSAIIKYALIW